MVKLEEQVNEKIIELANLISRIKDTEYKQENLFVAIGTLLIHCTDDIIEAYGLWELIRQGLSKLYPSEEEE